MLCRRALGVLIVVSGVFGVAQSPAGVVDNETADQMALVRAHPEAVVKVFSEKDLADGKASMQDGHDFLFALRSREEPALLIDGIAQPRMARVGTMDLYLSFARIEKLGTVHSFGYLVGEKRFGGSVDLAAFDADSVQHAGVPVGVLSAKLMHTSRIYDGMQSEYWVYVPAQYDAKTPAAVMVFQDGGGYLDRRGPQPALNVIDNLVAAKQIPVMICVFLNPGDISGAPGTPTFRAVEAYSKKWSRTLKDSMRSVEYDTVSDRYGRFLDEEILAEVGARYNLRKDAYSRGITGLSSGGIAAFNAAWQRPEGFSRVISWIGSFTAIQWHEDAAVADGGQDYPEKVLREDHRNVRVWLQDGANDMENPRYGSWPLANLRMANALELKGYDYRFRFGEGTHNPAHGAAEFPEEMRWLWRGYEAGRTSEVFVAGETERGAGVVRVKVRGIEK